MTFPPPDSKDKIMPAIAGYTLIAQISQSDRTLVYRALKKSNHCPVIIKVLRSQNPSPRELSQFLSQYKITSSLPIPRIARPISLEPWQNSYALVMEDCGSISLREYIHDHRLPLEKVLSIAIQMVEILHDLYQYRVIHKDIKPANILIHPETQQIKLIDFGIASLLPKEPSELFISHDIEGTLAYLAPEQTGRMNRGIDYRADFYALGITLFELLTGQLPFLSDDPMELVYCHLAKQPPTVEHFCPELPWVLSQVVSKLIAKNAEDRYQSALGLRYDLELCQSQWQATGQIHNFVIATRDISHQFSISEKIYGRETERQILLAAFDRIANGSSELILVTGFSGIGKTAIINEVHKPIAQQQGYFIKGKFDQLNRNTPFTAFIQAFRQLMEKLLTASDTQLQSWKNQLLKALGENAQVIIEVIPELEQIIGRQPPVPELSGTAAQNRFNLLFQNFVQVFTAPAHPLVIFIDDLQWADSASLKLMQLLMSESSTGYLLIVGAYRNNEVFPAHPLMLTLNEVSAAGVTVNTIALKSLDQDSINQLVADTLMCTPVLAQPLTELVYRYTKGNPFFTTQLLKALHQDGSITFESSARSWQFDISQINVATLTDDVVDLMTQQLYRLPESTQTLLKLAACMGNQFDLQTLTIVSEQTAEAVASNLWSALQEGLILPMEETYKLFQLGELNLADCDVAVSYRFLHDRVQQAAYAMITEDLKPKIHVKIGQLLLSNTSLSEQEERLFEIVNHLNIGITTISSPQKREQLAELNLAAGRKAKTATAYGAAINYLKLGINFLPATAWESHYSLMLKLHEEVAEASYLNTDFEQMEQWATVVLQQAKTLQDTLKVQQTRITGTKAQGQLLESIQIGLQVLKSLGIEFPAQPTQVEIEQAFNRTRSLWAGQSPLTLLDLPTMQDTHILACMEILTVLVPAAYISAPHLMLFLTFKQVELSIQFGNCPVSVFTYGDYGLILCGIFNDIENGYTFGELSLSLLEKLQLTSAKPRAWYVVHVFIKHWRSSLAAMIPYFQKAYKIGLETGDLEAACLSLIAYCQYAYHQGQDLSKLLETIDIYVRISERYKHKQFLAGQKIYQQTILNLLGRSEVPYLLTGEIFNSEKSLSTLQLNNQLISLFLWHLNQAFLYYLFGQDKDAVQTTAQTAQYLNGVVAIFMVPIYFFMDALIQLTQYPVADEPTRQIILLTVQQHQDKLQHWAALAPANHQHRCELVAAEQYRVLGNKADAIEAYDNAISHAKENRFIQDEALANELAAKFYLDWGKEKVAVGYMQEAYECYTKWGAKAKTDDLEQRYPHLLRSLKTQPIPLESLVSLSHSHPSVVNDTRASSSANSTLNQDLDFAAILKASQSLSSTIELKDLLHQLTKIILQNSGGDRCVLILNRDGEWQLEAVATPDQTTIVSKSLEGNQQIPIKLIQYVKHTQTVAVIDNLETNLPVIDEYLNQQKPKSILCLPILNQGDLTGILYLQNQVTSGVFTGDRIQVLNLLCTQAAISLKNAQLYQESQRNLETLRANESRLQSLSNNLPGVIVQIYINPQTGSSFTSYASSGCYELYEVTPEAMISGQYSLRTFEHPDDQESIAQTIRHSAEKLIPFLLEFRIITPTGKTKWVQTASQPTPMADDWIVWDGIVMDISDRKQAELELQQTNAELVRATRLKDEFLATMSHELRTPLNAILGMTEGLRDEIFGSITDRQHKALQTIKNSGSHLLALINDILDVAKIEAGKLELNYTSISVASLCNESLAFVQRQAQTKGIVIQTKFPVPLPNLWGDELRIRQVLINLLNNAVKFTPPGGSISLQVSYGQPSSQPTLSSSTQNYLQIAISDTGIGIAPEHINQLFQPFSQIDSRLNRNYEGTGLGLALVKRIVELHGGRVSLTSQVGVGSCFMIELPCDNTACSLPFDSQTTLGLSSSDTTVDLPPKAPLLLLADNNEANLETLSSYLGAKGYDIVVAKDGLEAINLTTLYLPNLILMDTQMPKMDGMDAIQQIRLDAKLTHIPIIALTTLAMPSDQERYLAVGATDYLSKPVKLKQLVVMIQKLLNQKNFPINKIQESE